MTGRINLTPEAERQLNEIDDWIAKTATADISRRFVSAILEHINGILTFPLAGRARDDVRPGSPPCRCGCEPTPDSRAAYAVLRIAGACAGADHGAAGLGTLNPDL